MEKEQIIHAMEYINSMSKADLKRKLLGYYMLIHELQNETNKDELISKAINIRKQIEEIKNEYI